MREAEKPWERGRRPRSEGTSRREDRTSSVQTPLRGRRRKRWETSGIWTFLSPRPNTQLTPRPERVSSHHSGLAQLLKHGSPSMGMVDGNAGSGKVR